METFVALLRAINVGGTGLLPMKDLAALCAGLGLAEVRTVLQTGNVVFRSGSRASDLAGRLEEALAGRMGRSIGVMIRTGAEMQAILRGNPFPDATPAQVAVHFLPQPAPVALLDGLTVPGREEVRPAGREVYVHYPDGMGRSTLRLPFAATATARNLNTVARLAGLAGA